jgi:hypothetical protein
VKRTLFGHELQVQESSPRSPHVQSPLLSHAPIFCAFRSALDSCTHRLCHSHPGAYLRAWHPLTRGCALAYVGWQVPRNLCLFLPKFHCELNWIERYWGAAKKYARRHCTYSLAALRTIVPIALSQSLDEIPEELRSDPAPARELPVSPVRKQRRWARISLQYAAEYSKLPRSEADAVMSAVNAQRSARHRDTNDPRARAVEAAMEEKAAHAWRVL